MADATDQTRPLAGTFAVGSRTDAFLRGAIDLIAAGSDADTARTATEVISGDRPLRDLTETAWMTSRLADALADPRLARGLAAAQQERAAGDDDPDDLD